jgi:hypothetical protein
MKTDRIKAIRSLCFLSLTALALGTSRPAAAQVEPEAPANQPTFKEDSWHVSVSPYLWLAGFNGTVSLKGYKADVNQSFGDILGNLKFGVMGLTEVRRGRVGLLTDLVYIRLGNEGAIPISGFPITVNLKASVNTFTLSPQFGYRLLENKEGAIDVLAGFRYYHVTSSIKANANQVGAISVSGSNDWADAIGGARFQANLTPKVGVFFIGDAGGGGSSPTWEIAPGIGYRWNQRLSTTVGYRRLYFNRQTTSGNAFGLDATEQGFILGATYRFR